MVDIPSGENTENQVPRSNGGSARSSFASRRGSSSTATRGHKRAPSGVADSPLKQVNTIEGGSQFKLKVVSVYERLFNGNPHPPGYWVEFFLLPVNKKELKNVIRNASPLSQHEDTIHTLVSAAIANLSPQLPADIIVNALDVLEIVFGEALDLSLTAPTSPVIQVLAGIDRASQVLDEFTGSLLVLLRLDSLNVVSAATKTVLNISKKTLGTQLSSLFATKNFFAALIGVIDKFVDHPAALNAFLAIGVLTALNTYDDDGISIYVQRISDFVDEAVMTKIIALVQREVLRESNTQLSSTQNKSISGWFSSWFGNQPAQSYNNETSGDDGAGTTESRDSNSQESKGSSWAILLPLSFFITHNTIFDQTFAASPALITLVTSSGLIFESASRQTEALDKSWLLLLIYRRLVDNQFLTLTDPAMATTIRLEATKLPLDTSRRVPLAGITDILQIALRSAARSKSPDHQYVENLTILLNQICSQMVITKTVWRYSWHSLWTTCMGLLKYFTSKKRDSASSSHANSGSSISLTSLANRGNFQQIVINLINTLTGMALHRDLLDEEDWSSLVYVIVQNCGVFNDAVEKFPDLDKTRGIVAARAMCAQYEISKESPDLQKVANQGRLAVGKVDSLVGEKHRPFSTLRNPVMKGIVKRQVKG